MSEPNPFDYLWGLGESSANYPAGGLEVRVVRSPGDDGQLLPAIYLHIYDKGGYELRHPARESYLISRVTVAILRGEEPLLTGLDHLADENKLSHDEYKQRGRQR